MTAKEKRIQLNRSELTSIIYSCLLWSGIIFRPLPLHTLSVLTVWGCYDGKEIELTHFDLDARDTELRLMGAKSSAQRTLYFYKKNGGRDARIISDLNKIIEAFTKEMEKVRK